MKKIQLTKKQIDKIREKELSMKKSKKDIDFDNFIIQKKINNKDILK